MKLVAGLQKGRRLKQPATLGLRPTSAKVREAVFGILRDQVPNARVLDLFAGTGAIGLEALSRGAGEVVFVERARNALVTLRGNVELLGAEGECHIVAGDAMAFVRRLTEGAFDLVMAVMIYPGFAKDLPAVSAF